MMLTARRPLQITVAVCGLVPVGAGLAGVLLGPGMAGDAVGTAAISLDSHFRYLSGLLLAIGVAFWCLVPGIDRHGFTFRLLSALVVAGGLARLAGLWLGGVPSLAMLFGLVMELVVTPLLCVWQALVARTVVPTGLPDTAGMSEPH
jgi:hypothetical protein